MEKLEKFGWSSSVQKSWNKCKFSKKLTPGRICIEYQNFYRVFTEKGPLIGEIAGRQKFRKQSVSDTPKVGDWVALLTDENEEKCIIHSRLERKSVLKRKRKGLSIEEQIIASNLDTVFIVMSLERSLNLNKIERFLSMVFQGNITPVIILNKADLCSDTQKACKEVISAISHVKCIITSCRTNEGIAELQNNIIPQHTYAFIGPSGSGKSALINAVSDKNIQKSGLVRAKDAKGRHTTTRREMFILGSGGIIIDTPGIRELQVWEFDTGIKETFRDIEQFAAQCRFNDCTHTHEKGCAVKDAVSRGELREERLSNYLRIIEEQKALKQKMTRTGRQKQNLFAKKKSAKKKKNKS